MRLAVLTLALAAGCHASTSAPTASGLTLHVGLATASTASDVAIASVALHLVEVRAVSDRTATDPRALRTGIDLALGDTRELALPAAPPGLYSAVDLLLGAGADTGLDVQAVWHAARVHATLVSTPFDVRCPDPVRLDPGHAARLTVQIDPASWFDGLDLGSAASDPDDTGIVISADDNRDLAAQLIANIMASVTLDCAPQ